MKTLKKTWHGLIWTLFRSPKMTPLSVTLAVYGYHFHKISEFRTAR